MKAPTKAELRDKIAELEKETVRLRNNWSESIKYICELEPKCQRATIAAYACVCAYGCGDMLGRILVCP